MSYKLVKANFVNKTQESKELDFYLRDFCCVDDDIYFTHKNGIGLMSGDEVDFDWCNTLSYVTVPDLTNLSSISYSKEDNSLYFVSDGGSQVGRINLQMLEFELLISPSSAKKFHDKYLSTDKSETHIVYGGGKVVWSVRDCHRCFLVDGDKAIPLVGNGRSGFSLSGLKNSRVCCPMGVAIMENTICFADSGNNCLRGISGDSTFNVIDDCKDLKNVFYDNKKLFFLGGNTIHMLSSEGDATHLFEVYKVEHKIQSFCPTGKDCIYILEKSDASTSEKTESNQPTGRSNTSN
jgi:hypothetical protein